MAASNQRYTQLLDEYIILKVSVSEALLRFYKTYPDILVDKDVINVIVSGMLSLVSEIVLNIYQ